MCSLFPSDPPFWIPLWGTARPSMCCFESHAPKTLACSLPEQSGLGIEPVCTGGLAASGVRDVRRWPEAAREAEQHDYLSSAKGGSG